MNVYFWPRIDLQEKLGPIGHYPMGKVTGSVSVLPLSTWLIMKQLVNMNPFNQVTRLLNFRLPNLFVAVRPLKFPSESSIRLFIATFR